MRRSGDTKTVKSRRSLLLPERCVEVLKPLMAERDELRDDAGDDWHGSELVFCTKNGTALSSENVRRDFRKVLDRAGLVRGRRVDAPRAAAQLRVPAVRS